MVTPILTTLLLAQVAAPGADTDMSIWLTEQIHWMIDQFHSRNFLPLCGVVIMIAVRVVHKLFGKKLEKKKLALVASLLGVISAVGMNLIGLAVGSSKVDILAAISNGIMVGAAASGFWNVLGKTASNKFDEMAGKTMKKLKKKKKVAESKPQDPPPSP